MLGILKAGGVCVPLDPAHTGERLAYYLADAQVTVGISTRTLGRYWPAGIRPVLLDADAPVLTALPATPLDPVTFAEDPAYVLYTSEAARTPTGVMVTHYDVVHRFHIMEHWYSFNEHDVWTLLPASAGPYAIWEIWGALLYGGCFVVVSPAPSHALYHRVTRRVR